MAMHYLILQEVSLCRDDYLFTIIQLKFETNCSFVFGHLPRTGAQIGGFREGQPFRSSWNLIEDRKKSKKGRKKGKVRPKAPSDPNKTFHCAQKIILGRRKMEFLKSLPPGASDHALAIHANIYSDTTNILHTYTVGPLKIT